MENLKVSVENGVKSLEIREGEALPLHEPVKVRIDGVIDTPKRWLDKRVEGIDQKKSHIIVNRDKMTISLIINETDHYRTEVSGKLEYHPDFLALGINQGGYITPVQMAELIKMNRSLFENRQTAMELVSQLRAFKGRIDKEVEAEFNPNKGDKRLFIAQKVDSNLPPSFNVCVPVFKGQKKQTFAVETYFNPDDLTCTLVSPDANDHEKEVRDGIIESVLNDIREVAEEIAIIEV
ncbi:hypothetical protein [Alistipes timonensis]|jgi:hypothetical protein|uniref:hypothetical protein n=1 Tax=Alistipes timonensis TaxID=1465754 RepID=UPI002052160D|nr:hypothetical protein [Alistipes timonensis]DAO68739.1 MAG TPA: protein of unknown function DUF2303 [Caudoviricetes sp.]